MSDQKKSLSPSMIILILLLIIVVPFLPILITWDWGWLEAWFYALLMIFGFIISRILATKRHPDLLIERGKSLEHEDIKSWDKILSRLIVLGGALIPLVAGLDMRCGWSATEFSLGWKIVALIPLLLGYAIGTWALIENRFFSGVVRIQKDRGHHVVDSGPYRWVRHPGYVGVLLTSFSTPILLDSLWTFGVIALYTLILILRTALEDRTLQEELPGYAEYAQRTRYRLFPGIW